MNIIQLFGDVNIAINWHLNNTIVKIGYKCEAHSLSTRECTECATFVQRERNLTAQEAIDLVTYRLQHNMLLINDEVNGPKKAFVPELSKLIAQRG